MLLSEPLKEIKNNTYIDHRDNAIEIHSPACWNCSSRSAGVNNGKKNISNKRHREAGKKQSMVKTFSTKF